jgi:RNA polymerase-associated protein CTR9
LYSLFQQLATYPDEDDQLPYSRKIADQRQKYGDSLLRRIQERQQHQAEWEAERNRILTNALAAREEARLAKEAAIEKERREHEEEERRIEELNRQIQQQALMDMRLLDEAEAEAEAAERSHSSDEEEGENGSGGTRAKRRRSTANTGNKKRQKKISKGPTSSRTSDDGDNGNDNNNADVDGSRLEELEEELARQEVNIWYYH